MLTRDSKEEMMKKGLITVWIMVFMTAMVFANAVSETETGKTTSWS